jgi:hypothetical protein
MATFTIDLLTGNLYLFSGDFSGSGSTPTSGSTYPQVSYFSDLPTPASSYTGQIYVVRNGSGSYVLNRKDAGLYISLGGTWRNMGETPAYFKSDNFQIYDSADTSKGAMFVTSGITGGVFRKLKIQNSDGTIAYLTDLNTKVDKTVFADYTGTTAPATYLTKTAFNTYSGITVPANYYNKTQINYYTGTTAPNTFLKLNQSTPQRVTGGAPKFDAINQYTGYTSTGLEGVGTRYWDVNNHTTSLVLENGVVLQDGQELHIYGKNISGGTIYNGQPVAVVRSNGQWTAFGKVDITTPAAYAFVGLATQDILHNAFGYVTIQGVVRSINTSHLDEGKAVYVNPTGGTTSIYPTVPNYVINVGVVERKHATQGRINVISKIVPKLYDLSDVNGTPLTTTGQIPTWYNPGQYFDFNYNINNYLLKTTFSAYTATTLLLINGKQDKLIAGSGISIVGNTISVTGGTPVSTTSAIQLLDTVGGVDVNTISATTINWTTQTFSGTSLSFTGGSRIYVKANGVYEVSYSFSAKNNNGSPKNIGSLIRKNGNTDVTPMSSSSFNQNANNNISTNIMPQYLVSLLNGDYVELKAFRIGVTGESYTKPNTAWLKMRKI